MCTANDNVDGEDNAALNGITIQGIRHVSNERINDFW